MSTLATPSGVVLLDQAYHWHAWGDEGQLVRLTLDDMTPTHRRRLLDWLRRNAAQLHAQQMDLVARRHRRGELTVADFLAALVALEAIEPAVWLEDTPLVRRLVRLVPREEARPRRRIHLPKWRRR